MSQHIKIVMTTVEPSMKVILFIFLFIEVSGFARRVSCISSISHNCVARVNKFCVPRETVFSSAPAASSIVGRIKTAIGARLRGVWRCTDAVVAQVALPDATGLNCAQQERLGRDAAAVRLANTR